MNNPFDDEAGMFFVLVNAEGQHSLWPSQNEVPAGWQKLAGPTSRKACIDFIEVEWKDMRPASLVRAMTEEDMGKNARS